MTSLKDLVIPISVGRGGSRSRVETKLKTWQKFVDMFHERNVLVDTTCTFAQYQKLDHDGQAEKKKAAGNWSPARFKDGRRKLVNQIDRTGVVFDLDYVTDEQLAAIRESRVPISRYAWVMHTTRSHCPEKPRVRMFVPVDRAMTLDEANAVTRFLATMLADDPEEGIEIPDIVSMRSNQIMYLPSRAKDQDYWRQVHEGEVLDVDAFLSDHPGWDDYALLPYQEREKTRGAVDPNRKMEDPHEKPGIIGAWCRTYDVEEAIAEFLPDIYIPGDSGGSDVRYTYALGTGSNGAVVYDGGKFLYSNHGSDPIEGAANSWDLVRIHKFGHLDAEAHANTHIGNLPSTKAMIEFAQSDERVSAELYAHLAAEIDAEFDDDDEDEDEDEDDDLADLLGEDDDLADLLGGDDDSADGSDDPLDDIFGDGEDRPKKKDKKGKDKPDMSWTKNFRRKANGDLEPVLNNIALICENDPRISRSVGFNEFTADPVCLRPIRSKKISLPSRALRKDEKARGRRWEDADDASIKLLASANASRGGYETDFSSQAVQEAVLIAGRNHPIHPVKDFIEDCHARWKAAGCPTGHIDSLAVRYFLCDDTPFHRESSRMFCIGAVARIYEPGCKFDHMLILEGATGAGKSTWLRNLSGGFFSEFRVDLDRMDRTVEAMRGNWFLEMDEMEKAKKADANQLKSFLSSQQDTIRLAYAKREMTFPRQCVICGTSNEDDYLTDPTSVRRYWIWRVHPSINEMNPIDQDALLAEVPMIWGEAYQAYLDMREAAGDGPLRLALSSREAIEEQRRVAEQSRRTTATEEIAAVIEEWLNRPVSRDEMEAEATHPVDAEFDDDDPGEGQMFLRNMATAREAFVALRNDPALAAYRSADARTFGKAMKLVPGWTEIGQCRRHGTKAVWFYRFEDGPRWVPAQDEPSVDDLLG